MGDLLQKQTDLSQVEQDSKIKQETSESGAAAAESSAAAKIHQADFVSPSTKQHAPTSETAAIRESTQSSEAMGKVDKKLGPVMRETENKLGSVSGGGENKQGPIITGEVDKKQSSIMGELVKKSDSATGEADVKPGQERDTSADMQEQEKPESSDGTSTVPKDENDQDQSVTGNPARSKNSSQFRGVNFEKNRGAWRAIIYVNEKQEHLGYFKTEEEAARAYDEAAYRTRGARVNFPVPNAPNASTIKENDSEDGVPPETKEHVKLETKSASPDAPTLRSIKPVLSESPSTAWDKTGRASSSSSPNITNDSMLGNERAKRSNDHPAEETQAPTETPAFALALGGDVGATKPSNSAKKTDLKIETTTAEKNTAETPVIPTAKARDEDKSNKDPLHQEQSEAKGSKPPSVDQKPKSSKDEPTQQPAVKGKRRGVRSTSQYRGVSWFKANRVWKAQITVQGQYEFLGYYDNEEEAARAYDRRSRELHGASALLNFPDRHRPSNSSPIKRHRPGGLVELIDDQNPKRQKAQEKMTQLASASAGGAGAVPDNMAQQLPTPSMQYAPTPVQYPGLLPGQALPAGYPYQQAPQGVMPSEVNPGYPYGYFVQTPQHGMPSQPPDSLPYLAGTRPSPPPQPDNNMSYVPAHMQLAMSQQQFYPQLWGSYYAAPGGPPHPSMNPEVPPLLQTQQVTQQQLAYPPGYMPHASQLPIQYPGQFPPTPFFHQIQTQPQQQPQLPQQQLPPQPYKKNPANKPK